MKLPHYLPLSFAHEHGLFETRCLIQSRDLVDAAIRIESTTKALESNTERWHLWCLLVMMDRIYAAACI